MATLCAGMYLDMIDQSADDQGCLISRRLVLKQVLKLVDLASVKVGDVRMERYGGIVDACRQLPFEIVFAVFQFSQGRANRARIAISPGDELKATGYSGRDPGQLFCKSGLI
ncbi:MAG: hypothetical protein RIC36_14760 [Rhodospirillales bacterium]